MTEFVTVDGVVEDPGGAERSPHGGWAFRFRRGEAGDRFKRDELMAAEAQLLGRVTYQGFAAAWPSRTDQDGFADRMNRMPKYVVSSTLDNPSWTNTTVLRGLDEVAKLKEGPGGDLLVHGSPTLVRSLARRGLVDQYRLMVFPLLAGGGIRLFGEADAATPLRLVEANPVGDEGVLTLVYEPA